ncbi:hypothetical protein FHY55_00445 [Oceanicola sp. D3]|uniref:hypothetical protein n=1 Tax=Oceanicola sp. D3 TaxID=2587163 RepID=UPI00111EA038|nr:hypothetical protein [Oceanicola sp. D3]QDC07804.1 hypothetical protein FHY55_00445 [Oceanicola sp. D3]
MSLNWERFKAAQANYVRNNRSPCSDGYTNQCAIRVSSALVDAAWPFNGTGQRYTEERFGPLCSHGRARGARSLADYLEVYLKRPRRYIRPAHPTTGVRASEPGVYEADGTFYPVLDWLKKKAGEGQKLRGIMFFGSPHHIDGFDLHDSTNTQGSYGMIGEEYASSSDHVRVFFL